MKELKPRFETLSGIELKRSYGPDAVRPEGIGLPGEFPYTRGIQPTMFRGKLCTMRQYAGFGSAAETNQRFTYLLAHGQTGLSVAFDLPTQIGMDSDHPLAAGEAGKVGVAIDSLHDMEALLNGIPLDRVSTSMTINATAAILLAMYIAVAKKQGVAPKQISGTIQNDILKEYIARGTYIYPPAFSLRLITDVFAYCQREVPNWNTISISGYHIREAGSTAVQELAFTFGNAITYVQAAIDRGLDIDDFAPRLSFFFNAHNDFLEEIAKFRAARRMWARIARDRFGAKNPRSQMLRFHAQTAGSSLTAQQPDNNVVRVTIQGLAAILGGAQSLHTNSKDEALGLPTADAARLALRTQQIIAFESGVANTVDPVGGSYAIEALTDALEQEATAYLDKIDAMGGMLAAIESGWVQKQIQDAAYTYQRAIETKARVLVGVNEFQTEEESEIPIHTLDPAFEAAQVTALARARSGRDARAVSSALERLAQAARGSDNLMPYILEAVEAYATIGEVSDGFRKVHGEYREALTV
ncbi:MAG: methylmalonyl-CoA mutase family protein [Acidobacteria bacterium]|nr:methylmalonyl-CoA mutase family protein [Acidobacteriota bacterium]